MSTETINTRKEKTPKEMKDQITRISDRIIERALEDESHGILEKTNTPENHLELEQPEEEFGPHSLYHATDKKESSLINSPVAIHIGETSDDRVESAMTSEFPGDESLHGSRSDLDFIHSEELGAKEASEIAAKNLSRLRGELAAREIEAGKS